MRATATALFALAAARVSAFDSLTLGASTTTMKVCWPKPEESVIAGGFVVRIGVVRGKGVN